MPSNDKLAVTFNADERISIAQLDIIFTLTLLCLFLHPNIRPNLVKLYIINFDIAEFGFQQPLALLTDEDEQRKDSLFLDASNACDATDRNALDEHVQDHQSLFQRQAHVVKGFILLFAERLAALLTEKALVSFAVFADFNGFDLAVV